MILPAFSIVMPTYNRAYCIANAIDSLLELDKTPPAHVSCSIF